MFSQINMHLICLFGTGQKIPVILFNLQNVWSSRGYKKWLWEGQKMSSADKMHCSHLIKRRGGIRPISPQKIDLIICTHCAVRSNTQTNSRGSSLSVFLCGPPLSFLISVQPLSRCRHLMTHFAGLLPFH